MHRRSWLSILPAAALGAWACRMPIKLPGGAAQPAPPASVAPDAPPAAVEPDAPPAAAVGEDVVADLAPDAAMPGEDTSNIPPLFVQLVRSSYIYEKPTPPRPDLVRNQQENVAGTRNNNYAMIRPAVLEFEKHWEAYTKRKKEIDAVVARAEALEQQGNHAGAQALLEAALPAPTPHKGERWAGRTFVEAADAEAPALFALARIAAAQRTAARSPLRTIIRVQAGLWERRGPADHDTELFLWLAADKTAANRVRTFSGSDPSGTLRKAEQGVARAFSHERWQGKPPPKDADLPPALAEIIGKQAGSSLDRWPALFDEAPALIDKFDAGWRPYADRRAEVATAVKEAETLEKGGKLGDARARLEQALTPAAPAADGSLPAAPRRWVESRDAELPALRALARVAAADKQYRTLVGLVPHLWVRREVADADRELIAHIVRGGKEDYDGRDGDRLAEELWGTFDAAGLHQWVPQGETSAPKGSWGILVLPTHNFQNMKKVLAVKERSVELDLTIDAFDRHCKKTNRVERIEPDGSVRYEEECTYTPRKDVYKAEAALAEAAPAWARSLVEDASAAKKSRRLIVIGQVVKASASRWTVKDAVIVDLRFFR